MCEFYIVFDVILEKINKKEMFTAFDVFKEVKKRGLKEKYRDIKKDINSLYFSIMFDYERSIVHIPNVSISTFIYHPKGTDANKYVKINNLSKHSVDIRGRLWHSVDIRGRLWIPSKYITDIGISIGNNVYVTFDGFSLIITKNIPKNATKLASYKVDRHGNVAISKSVFIKSGLSNKKYYLISGNKKEIKVKIS